MRKTNTKIVGGVLLLAIILIAVGYAVITNVPLNINGKAQSEAKQGNFVVEMTGTPQTSGAGTITATIDSSNKTQGTMEVTGLNAKGDTAIVVYTITNKSEDLSADLTAEATSSNEEYFEVVCELGKTTLKAKEETTMTVKVKLLKTPIDETKENLTTKIGVNIEAEPKQPGEEQGGTSGGSTSGGTTTTGAYLPTGFTKVAGTTLDNGYTIQDSKGNQYVWVEVPKTEEVYPTAGLKITEFTDDEYTKIENDLHTYTNDYRNGTSYKDEYYTDSTTGLTNTQYTELKKKMLKSVYQNGGFYVGKYETGIEDAPKTSGSSSTAPTETPVIKQNAYPYNYVTCSQAQTLASNMESGKYTSSLMFGVQWDLVLKYLEKKGTAQADLKTDSTNWGNYSNNYWNITNTNSKYAPDGSGWTSGAYGQKIASISKPYFAGSNYFQSVNYTNAVNMQKTSMQVKSNFKIAAGVLDGNGILLSTGASDTFSKQGIYDLTGNVGEWTLEYTSNSSTPCVCRGGNYIFYGSDYPAAYRRNYGTTRYDDGVGFRVSLF